jgi:outer membrane lipoprotein-sorting protein
MRSSVRWLVPVAVAATVAGGVAINSAAAGSAPQLPGSTPQKVLAAMAAADVTALSGTVVTRADIGFPSISSFGGHSGSGASSTDLQGLVTRFLSGENTLRVWSDGPSRQRAQLLDPFDELNVIRNGKDVWTYASKQNAVQHAVVPSGAERPGAATRPGDAGRPGGAATAAELAPAALAQRMLAAADPTTAVTLGESELVAGRPAYALTLTPRTDRTLIDHVVIAVDSAKSVPLQVQVFARTGDQPVIETGFTAIDFGTPSADTFRFTPPKGATVTELGKDGKATAATKPSASGSASGIGSGARPTVIGTGWASVVEFAAPKPAATTGSTSKASSGATRAAAPSGDALLKQLGTPVPGGRAISTKLVSVLVTDDGRVFAGAVPVQVLLDAARR